MSEKLIKFLKKERTRLSQFALGGIGVMGSVFLLWHFWKIIGSSIWGILGLCLVVSSATFLFVRLWIFYKPKDFIAAYMSIAAVILAILSTIFGGQQAWLLRQQIELENRPFVSIEDPFWWFEEDGAGSFWLWTGFHRNNYGQKPAEEVQFRNFRAIIVSINDEALANKIRQRTSKGQEKYLSEYILDERNRLVLHLVGLFASYFRSNPDASKDDVNIFGQVLARGLVTSQDLSLSFYKNEPLFRLVEVNNEMRGYLGSQRTTVFPHQDKVIYWTLQMGSGLKEILGGENLLISFFGFRYEGPVKNAAYSTFFLGYGDRNLSLSKIAKGSGGAFFREFQTWTAEASP